MNKKNIKTIIFVYLFTIQNVLKKNVCLFVYDSNYDVIRCASKYFKHRFH